MNLKIPSEAKTPAPSGDDGHGREPTLHITGNIDMWSLPSDARDGFDVRVGQRGHVIISQRRPYERVAEIILHPLEARALARMLPAAIYGWD